MSREVLTTAMSDVKNSKPDQEQEFERLSHDQRVSFMREYLYVLRTYKKLWMLPIILVLLAFGLLMALSTSGVAPFIYTLF